ncbi:DUF2490 domain-containing protein [Pedobacter aquatilis]|uniref:DUF2490 domain-containing protein n=1 Tax=Pedobacter aquatilis TaxID=351343 RepID=UPI00292EA047|nr:DUF2490 domain-containing protein [Pedobacter aquatilis]
MKNLILTIAFCFFSITALMAQRSERTGWLFLNNTKRIGEKYDFLSDVQVRSADGFEYVNTLLLRGALSYNFSTKHSAALGYAYKADWTYDNDLLEYSPEHRIYEQYLFSSELRKFEINARFRLEQRFVKKKELVNFSQRARAFLSAQIPLKADTGFSRGIYAKIQNEIFMNVQNREKVNNSIFDQNRTSIGIGFRFSKSLDIDFSYLYWYQHEVEKNTKTNVFQFMLTSKF